MHKLYNPQQHFSFKVDFLEKRIETKLVALSSIFFDTRLTNATIKRMASGALLLFFKLTLLNHLKLHIDVNKFAASTEHFTVLKTCGSKNHKKSGQGPFVEPNL